MKVEVETLLRGCVFLGVIGLCTACTEPGRTTAVGAATGGVIGAGVGAIVGNQAGDPGAGLVIGSLAGAGAGAAIGNKFEAQEKIIKTQEEALSRQERQIIAQQGQIEELRRLSQDQVAYKDSYDNSGFNNPSYGSDYGKSAVVNQAFQAQDYQGITQKQDNTYSMNSTIRGSEPTYMPPSVVAYNNGVQNGTIKPVENVKSTSNVNTSYAMNTAGTQNVKKADTSSDSMRASYSWQQAPEPKIEKTVAPETTKELSDDCREAANEAASAKTAESLADQLFHFRRALRLCPENPGYHNSMGEVYMHLDRQADAKFEFEEALKIDPNFSAAKSNLQSVSK